MKTRKRQERETSFYKRLNQLCKKVEFRPDLAEYIYHSVVSNVSTTELNQINIVLENVLKEIEICTHP